MKIGLITHYMPPHSGGIERVAEMLFTAYAHRGLEVRWVASRVPEGAATQEGDRIRVPCWNGLEQRLGVPVPVWGVPAWREVMKLAVWADVLHVHDCLYPGSALGVLFGKSLGKPVLLSQHIGFIRYRTAALRLLEQLAFATLGRWLLRRASRVAFATPAAEAYVTRLLGQYPENASLVPNGIDTSRFRPAGPQEQQTARETLGLPENGPVVLFVGRLVEKKGIDLVVEVSRAVPEATFLVVGDGPLAGNIPSEANVVWHRSIEPERIHECYHASDCFLLPSHGEGLPLVVQEAAACGLPMIVSEGEVYAGPLVQQGVCIAAPRNGNAMADRVRRVLKGEQAGLGSAARAHAERHWSLDSMATRYIALLEEATDERRKVRGDGRPH
jgi:glycosyltransferase involved in cell wall biosynthesis